MGVRGLQTFIEKECPDACKYVSIKEIADYHGISNNCQPVLVVDGMSMLNRLYQNTSLEWIYGGQWLQFLKILEDFISRFKDIGVNLVFFFDGTICAAKRQEWVRRRVSKYETIDSIFKDIKATFSEPDRRFFQLPTSMGTLARFAVKELGSQVYQTDKDADEAIAEYANIHKEVFGILSQDSDFIIYNTKTYLSLMHLDLNSLQTIHYDRDCFASRYLKMSVSQLPLFACLNGNDFVPSEKLRGFHQRISNNNGKIYMAAMAGNMAKVITREGWTGDANNLRELERISLIVFGHPGWATLIQDGLKSYIIGNCVPAPKVCIKVGREFQQAVHDRHLNCLNTFLFNLMCKLEYESSETMEDPSCSRPPSALIYRQIRQRCYGVIFNQYFQPQDQVLARTPEGITIKEWCAYPGNNMTQPEYIKALPLEFYEGRIPSIEDVWFKLAEKEKMMLFWSILHVPMDFKVLITIPNHLMVLACILHYLIGGMKSGPLLKPWEVAVFVAQAIMKKTANDLHKLAAPQVDAEAVSLSTLFMRGVSTVLLVYSACDAPFPLTYVMPWHFFDGKLFHHLYVKAKHMPSVHELCCRQEEVIKEFYELLSAITRNTVYDFQKLDWRKVLGDFSY